MVATKFRTHSPFARRSSDAAGACLEEIESPVPGRSDPFEQSPSPRRPRAIRRR